MDDIRSKMDNLTNPTLLDDMEADYQIFKLKHYFYQLDHELWRKWIRS